MKNILKIFFTNKKEKLIRNIKTNKINSINFEKNKDLILDLCLNLDNWILTRSDTFLASANTSKVVVYFRLEEKFFTITLFKHYDNNKDNFIEKCYFDSDNGLYYSISIEPDLQEISKEEIAKYIHDKKQSSYFRLNDNYNYYFI